MRNRYILLVDVVAVLLCVSAAFVLRLDWQAPLAADHPFAEAVRFSLIAAPLLKLPVWVVSKKLTRALSLPSSTSR